MSVKHGLDMPTESVSTLSYRLYGIAYTLNLHIKTFHVYVNHIHGIESYDV